jgi:uncharacterized membrane-anchored protein YitT (DUF2179 family)
MAPLLSEKEKKTNKKVSFLPSIKNCLRLIFGAFVAAFAIHVFFLPNDLFDGGIVGLAMIAGRITHNEYIPYFLILFNLPFFILAFHSIGKTFVAGLTIAVIAFSSFLALLPHYFPYPFTGDPLEVVVIGGAILGVGIGTIIRYGGCLDGTEILGIIINKRLGFTVGQVVFICNLFVFGMAGIVFRNWHPPLLSLITYIIVVKIMDSVIVGLDETKAVLVVSRHHKEIAESIVHEMGLGLTILLGKGGYLGEPTEVLYVITERLQLFDLKKLIYSIDPKAFIAIENLHEISTGIQGNSVVKRNKKIKAITSRAFSKPS